VVFPGPPPGPEGKKTLVIMIEIAQVWRSWGAGNLSIGSIRVRQPLTMSVVHFSSGHSLSLLQPSILEEKPFERDTEISFRIREAHHVVGSLQMQRPWVISPVDSHGRMVRSATVLSVADKTPPS
jgi:hypothetical protein